MTIKKFLSKLWKKKKSSRNLPVVAVNFEESHTNTFTAGQEFGNVDGLNVGGRHQLNNASRSGTPHDPHRGSLYFPGDVDSRIRGGWNSPPRASSSAYHSRRSFCNKHGPSWREIIGPFRTQDIDVTPPVQQHNHDSETMTRLKQELSELEFRLDIEMKKEEKFAKLFLESDGDEEAETIYSRKVEAAANKIMTLRYRKEAKERDIENAKNEGSDTSG